MAYPVRPSDEFLVQLYLANGWEDPGNVPSPDPAIAEDVWGMLSAPTLDAALEKIEYWGPSTTRRQEVASLRARAGVKDASVESAYSMGYEHGWAGHSLRPLPEGAPTDPACLLWFKAGFADGNWDHLQGHLYKTTQEGPGTDQVG